MTLRRCFGKNGLLEITLSQKTGRKYLLVKLIVVKCMYLSEMLRALSRALVLSAVPFLMSSAKESNSCSLARASSTAQIQLYTQSKCVENISSNLLPADICDFVLWKKLERMQLTIFWIFVGLTIQHSFNSILSLENGGKFSL